MKKNNFWENIKNGLKKAVTFVVDVLLFIPRFLINGIKGFFSKEESESEELVEKFEDDEEDSTPIPEEEKAQESEPTSEETPAQEPAEESTDSSVNEEPKAEESVTTESQEEKPEKEVKAEFDAKQESEKVETAQENGKTVVEVKVTTSSSGSDVAATSEPVSEETPAQEPVEESTDSSVNEEPKAEESVTTESQEEKPEKEVKAESDAKQESEKVETADQPKKKAPTKKNKSTTKVVEADVVDDKGNVVKESVKAEEEIKEMQIFGESDKKAAVHEKAFMAYFNNASKKYGKNLWLDGATELQKFARAYLDAIAVKEKMTVTKSQSRYGDIIKELHDASKMTDAEKNDLEIFLGRQNYMQDKNVDNRINIAYRFITDYQSYYYRDWFYAQQQGFDPNAAATA